MEGEDFILKKIFNLAVLTVYVLMSEVIRDSHSGEPLQLAVQQQNNFAVGRKNCRKNFNC